MNWIKLIGGIILVILGIWWFFYELGQTIDLKDKKDYMLLSYKPDRFVAIIILLGIGIGLIVKAL